MSKFITSILTLLFATACGEGKKVGVHRAPIENADVLRSALAAQLTQELFLKEFGPLEPSSDEATIRSQWEKLTSNNQVRDFFSKSTLHEEQFNSGLGVFATRHRRAESPVYGTYGDLIEAGDSCSPLANVLLPSDVPRKGKLHWLGKAHGLQSDDVMSDLLLSASNALGIGGTMRVAGCKAIPTSEVSAIAGTGFRSAESCSEESQESKNATRTEWHLGASGDKLLIVSIERSESAHVVDGGKQIKRVHYIGALFDLAQNTVVVRNWESETTEAGLSSGQKWSFSTTEKRDGDGQFASTESLRWSANSTTHVEELDDAGRGTADTTATVVMSGRAGPQGAFGYEFTFEEKKLMRDGKSSVSKGKAAFEGTLGETDVETTGEAPVRMCRVTRPLSQEFVSE